MLFASRSHPGLHLGPRLHEPRIVAVLDGAALWLFHEVNPTWQLEFATSRLALDFLPVEELRMALQIVNPLQFLIGDLENIAIDPGGLLLLIDHCYAVVHELVFVLGIGVVESFHVLHDDVVVRLAAHEAAIDEDIGLVWEDSYLLRRWSCECHVLRRVVVLVLVLESVVEMLSPVLGP